jgi:hypothetical protein
MSRANGWGDIMQTHTNRLARSGRVFVTLLETVRRVQLHPDLHGRFKIVS